MIEFARPLAFLALPLPLLVWFVLPPLASRRALWVPPGVAAMLLGLATDRDATWRARSASLLIPTLGWLALILALAGPQIPSGSLLTPGGRDILLAVDLSASMSSTDIQTPGGTAQTERLALMRAEVADFAEARDGDRLALIGFASDAYLVAPLTHDVRAVAQTLDQLRVGLPGRRTDLGRAIGLAVQTLKDEPAQDRSLVVLTDGQSNAGGLSALDAADLAAALDLKIHLIGLAAEIDPKNAEHMQEIADRTGGTYHAATSPDALSEAYARISALAPVERTPRITPLVQDLSWAPTLLALVLAGWLGVREFRDT